MQSLVPMGSAGPVGLNLNIDLDGLLSKTWEKFLHLFGKDAESQNLKEWLNERTHIAFLDSRDVQCIGMHQPVLISDIYQPTRLVRDRPQVVTTPGNAYQGVGRKGRPREWEATEPETISVQKFLRQRQSSIVTAGPGWGKTTFLHWVFLDFLLRGGDHVFPMLIKL